MTLRLPKAALLIALPMLAVPAFAADPEPKETAPSEEKAGEKAEEKKICKRISAQAGSRRKTKVCRTREEWKTFNQEQRNRNGRLN